MSPAYHPRLRTTVKWTACPSILLVVISLIVGGRAEVVFMPGSGAPSTAHVAAGQEAINAQAERDALAWRKKHTPPGAKELARLKICVGPTAPYTFCDPLAPNTTKFTGFEVELFRYLAPNVPFLGKEGEDWYFACGDYSPLYADVSSDNGTCLLLAGGLASTNQSPRGSLSVLTKGWAILVRSDFAKKKSLFSPFFAFSVPLWLALISTAALVGVALWLLETAARAMDREPEHEKPDEVQCPLCSCAVHRHLPGGAGSAAGDDRGGAYRDAAAPKDTPAAAADAAGDRAERGASNDAGAGGRDGGGGGESDSDGQGGGAAPSARADSGRSKSSGRSRRAKPAAARRSGGARMRSSGALAATASQGIVHVLERGHGSTLAAVEKLDETVRQVFLQLTRVSHTTTVSNSTLPSQMVLWAWGLLTMITISMFTAATAAKMTTSALETGIKSLADLRGMRTIVWKTHLEEGRYDNSGIIPVPMEWENTQTEMDMVNALRAGKGDAIVQDSNFVAYYAGTECDVVQAGDRWGERFVAYIWGASAPPAMIDSVDFALRDAIENGAVESLREHLVEKPVKGCSTRREDLAKSTTIKFGQVAGLWVILAIAMVGAFGAAFAMLLTRRFRMRQRAKLRAVSVIGRRPSVFA